MHGSDGQYARRALLAEVEDQRREHPQIVLYHIASVIHAAGLDASATLDDLDDAGLRSIAVMGREYIARARSQPGPHET